MKLRPYITLVLLVVAYMAMAQNESDALKFTQFLPSGTARSTAMGGAFSALGADLSTMATNPAGTGLYRKGDVGVSTAWTNHNTYSMYNGMAKETDESSYQLGNLGFVVATPTGSSAGWKTVNFGFAYNHLNDYNRVVSIMGNNEVSSLLDYQTDILNNDPNQVDDNAYFKADAVYFDSSSNQFVNDYQFPNENYGATQAHQLITDGYAGEYDINVSSNYNDVLYLGLTLAFQHIDYDQTTIHSETPYNETPSSSIALRTFSSNDYLGAIGNGFSFKFGLLYKITPQLRVGAAFHTPTNYNFKYDYWTDVYATIEYMDGIKNNTGNSARGYYEWEFKAPARYILSSSYIIGNVAIISGEIEYANYSNMNISANDYLFGDENQKINDIYDGAINARIGGEVKFGILSLRAGAGFIDSPYKNTEPNADAYKLMLSTGFGVNMGIVYFDAAYQYVTSDEYYYMYGYKSSEVSINNRSHKIMTTLGIRF